MSVTWHNVTWYTHMYVCDNVTWHTHTHYMYICVTWQAVGAQWRRSSLRSAQTTECRYSLSLLTRIDNSVNRFVARLTSQLHIGLSLTDELWLLCDQATATECWLSMFWTLEFASFPQFPWQLAENICIRVTSLHSLLLWYCFCCCCWWWWWWWWSAM